jgi:predicted small metal-binding protein
MMAKQLRCGDVVPGCSAVIEGKDDREVLKKAAEHAKSAHGMATIPPDVASKVQQAIQPKAV